ncbi:hypothetical protein [Streptomyces iranensis]|uniref:Secreted protein n=1 Tax=Streptomyces iranensis TaxID=576784 RepID=A0ABS4MIM4_9ACTN|nr:hypothetical protein [Streptomyces iranensis]MBP2059544.1 hypothetical protein [Streptomyces iranensis]
MTRKKKTVVLWALATSVLATSASPALADRNNTVAPPERNQTVTALRVKSCVTTGGAGSVRYKGFSQPVQKLKLRLWAWDAVADGQHVRVRLVTKNHKDHKRYWKWHKTSSDNKWRTTARDNHGIFNVGVQVAQFKGNKRLELCTSWK